ncbi:UTP--glucose-1-phosphate uridylyltransferase [Albimonas donghaensis]|uniref:UTP--glucose-1-phosphate uridylyltransferase n=1 Tax=Albimonas donghaensis TaxID=356660 RepID=A0A1H2S5U0_9RHOB|nr:UTP--glucose-1-phosphate uridylyltransferase [Albimonas donghaensis]SDW27012.1 UTP--glucose-1-phosphate uridylyltransferase [Albimonas donghaensis]
MTSPIRTAVFPVAGLGTRFLPATKATPKELLPVIDTPLIQFAIDEARAAGIEKMVFVSHPTKASIERYVRHDHDLAEQLRDKGKGEVADMLQGMAACPHSEEIQFVMQDQPLGLGHAVLMAREHVGEEAFAVILPDDLILGEPGCLKEMVEAHAQCGGHLVASMEVAPEETKSYGVLDVLERKDKFTRARGMVEKPAPEDAPSRLAVVGRYVLDSSIFEDLATQTPGAGGEIQLTDAIAAGIARVGLAGFEFSGKRFDCGSKSGMLAAKLHMAAGDPEYADVMARHGLRTEQIDRIAAE